MKVSWHFCIALSVSLNSFFDAGLDAGKFTTGLKNLAVAFVVVVVVIDISCFRIFLVIEVSIPNFT